MEGIPLAGPHSSRTNGGLFNAVRARIPFRSVNLPGKPGYQRGMQRHHLLPRQLLGQRHFARLLDRIGRERIGFDDFRFNGLLLPAVEKAAVVLGLPLHRGPHRMYNEVVSARVAQIEGHWNARRRQHEDLTAEEVLMRMRLWQAALRRSPLQPASQRMQLNRFDPLGQNVDFAELDAMADALWATTDVGEG